MVTKTAKCRLPTEFGNFIVISFVDQDKEHLALTLGELSGGENILCRVHTSCLLGESFHATNCNCHLQLCDAMKAIQKEGKGVIVYLDQQGGGRGLAARIRELASLSEKTKEGLKIGEIRKGEPRIFKVAAEIIKDLGIRSVRLMTSNQKKVEDLRNCGVNVLKMVPF